MRQGRPAPWAGLGPDERRIDLAHLRTVFDDAGPAVRSPREHLVRRSSAVLAPLYDHDGETYVILTRRSSGLRVHSGEVSFPGGGRDGSESLPDTARRETFEEVGINPSQVEIIGELDHLSTITSDSFIAPYVGVIHGNIELRPSPAEVEAVLRVPLVELLDSDVYREEVWNLFGTERSIYFFELVGDTVWGATASMLRQLLGFGTGTLRRGDLDHL